MVNFDYCFAEGKIRKVRPNNIRALSLIKSSTQAINTAKIIPLDINSAKTIFRELYKGLREYCEAIGYQKGYKFLDHESIGFFLRDFLNDQSIFNKFDRYRKLRNGINYYGEDIELTTVKEAMTEIPVLIKNLGKHSTK